MVIKGLNWAKPKNPLTQYRTRVLNPALLLRGFVLVMLIMNLTLVCQGHNKGDHHTGSHLVFLDEPNEMMEGHQASYYNVCDPGGCPLIMGWWAKPKNLPAPRH